MKMYLENIVLIITLLCLVVTESFGQQDKYQTPEELVDQYFLEISGNPKEQDWQKFEALFLPTVQFNAVGIDKNGTSVFFSQRLDAFVNHLQEYTNRTGFFQNSLERKAISYADIGQVVAVFESRNTQRGEIIDRGLICFHLVRKEGRWWIAGVLWNSETRQNPLPADILKD